MVISNSRLSKFFVLLSLYTPNSPTDCKKVVKKSYTFFDKFNNSSLVWIFLDWLISAISGYFDWLWLWLNLVSLNNTINLSQSNLSQIERLSLNWLKTITLIIIIIYWVFSHSIFIHKFPISSDFKRDLVNTFLHMERNPVWTYLISMTMHLNV